MFLTGNRQSDLFLAPEFTRPTQCQGAAVNGLLIRFLRFPMWGGGSTLKTENTNV